MTARGAERRAHAAVLAAAVLFGSTFVIVKDAVADVGVVPFLAVRFLVGAAVLLPFALRRRAGGWEGVVPAGAVCGTVLLAGYLFQTVGLQYTSASVSAFITYLLVVLVPVLSTLVLRRRPAPTTIAGVVLATAGLFLLTGRGHGLGLGRGELLTLGCALAFAVHILVLAEVSPRFDTVRLTAVQLAVVGGACLVPGVFLGGYAFTGRAWAAAVYTGATVSALAFSLQVYGQRRVGPTRTSLLLTMEPVAAAVVGALAGERLGWVGAAGAALILAGIAVAELPLAGGQGNGRRRRILKARDKGSGGSLDSAGMVESTPSTQSLPEGNSFALG
ncbi:MAG TPA: DMT family transporter [Acidimicrobiales bacterium]|nr:DMT family transporter [Acidimicrobiales bacterium]